MAVRTIYLLRHGHYQSWDNTSLDGEGRLTDYGKQQAEAAAKQVSGLPLMSIHCSTLNRARETCQIVVEQFPQQECVHSEILREGIPAIPPRWEDYLKGYPPEDLVMDRARADQAFESYFIPPDDSDMHELIVAHGNLIRYLVCRVLEVDIGSWGYMDVDHCSLTEIRISANGWTKLVSLNDTSHIPAHLVTSNQNGGLADTLWQAAQLARDNNDLEMARNLGQDALGHYFSLNHELIDDIKRWLEELPA